MSSREDRRRRAADKLPPQNRIPQNLEDFKRPFFEIVEYGVASWCPEKDGKGPMTAVALHLTIKMGDKLCELVMRLKTPRAVDEMIALLERNRDNVWPGGDSPGGAA